MACIIYRLTPRSKDVRYVVYYPEYDIEPDIEKLRACATNFEAQKLLTTSWGGKPELLLPKDIAGQVFESVRGDGETGGYYTYIEITLRT